MPADQLDQLNETVLETGLSDSVSTESTAATQQIEEAQADGQITQIERDGLVDFLRTWFNLAVIPNLQSAQTNPSLTHLENDEALKRALRDYLDWQGTVAIVGLESDDVLPADNQFSFATAQGLVISGLQDAIERDHESFATSTDLRPLYEAFVWANTAFLLAIDTEVNHLTIPGRDRGFRDRHPARSAAIHWRSGFCQPPRASDFDDQRQCTSARLCAPLELHFDVAVSAPWPSCVSRSPAVSRLRRRLRLGQATRNCESTFAPAFRGTT